MKRNVFIKRLVTNNSTNLLFGQSGDTTALRGEDFERIEYSMRGVVFFVLREIKRSKAKI